MKLRRTAVALAEAVSRKIVWIAAALCAWLAAPCAAQVVGDAPPAPAQASTIDTVEYLTRYAFHLNAESILVHDRRFSWDADFGGDIDLVQYPKGRLTFIANYEVIAGKELRRFDAEQGNYILAGAFSRQTPHGEFAGVFHHVSRHLSDRPKIFGLDWNLLGVRWIDTKDLGPDRKLHLEHHVLLARAILRSNIDYTWTIAAGGTLRKPVTDRVSSFGGLDLTLVGTADPNPDPDRGVLKGSGIEGGVRLRGRAASVELFGRLEHRIDAEMVERVSRSWLLLGFRILSP